MNVNLRNKVKKIRMPAKPVTSSNTLSDKAKSDKSD